MRKIKIKVKRQRMEVLLSVYQWVFANYNPESPYEQLLYHIVGELHHSAAKQLDFVTQENFTIVMSEVQAMGFFQIFHDLDLRSSPFADVVVREVIAAIDRIQKYNHPKKR